MSKPETKRVTRRVLTAVAVGMSIASIVLGFIPGVADADTQVTLLGIGLAALAVGALLGQEDREEGS